MEAIAPAGPPHTARGRAYQVIFEHDTPAGRAFDVALITAILASVVVVMLDSVASWRLAHGRVLHALEWTFTVAFTVEYVLRVWCVRRARTYVVSFFGVIDLLAVLPTYVSVLIPGSQVLAAVRILRVLRVFRVLKLVQFVGESRVLWAAISSARYKVTVFLVTVVSIVVVVGSLMYVVEGPEAGFTSIPVGVYWGIVTLTTVGYGDIAPITPLGQALASLVMVLGYAIIAVPTGIVTVEMAYQDRLAKEASSQACPRCGAREPDARARFCRSCGTELGTREPERSE